MLHQERSGQGPPVVLLHSGGMSGRQWRRLARRLAPAHEVRVPDLLGSGANPPWPGAAPFELQMEVEAVEEGLASLSWPVHLVGHSYGGFLALAIARRNPARVRSLAVYDPVAFGVLHDDPESVGRQDLESVVRQPIFLDEARGGSAAWFEVFVDYWNGPGTWSALAPDARAAFTRVGRKVYLEARALVAERTGAEAYARVTAPTLLLGGQHSPPAARRVLARLAEALPSARSHVIPGAGHMGPISHAGEVNEAVAAHLAAVEARSAD